MTALLCTLAMGAVCSVVTGCGGGDGPPTGHGSSGSSDSTDDTSTGPAPDEGSGARTVFDVGAPDLDAVCEDVSDITFTIIVDTLGHAVYVPNYCAPYHAACSLHGAGTVGLECVWYACNASSRVDVVTPTKPDRVFHVTLRDPC